MPSNNDISNKNQNQPNKSGATAPQTNKPVDKSLDDRAGLNKDRAPQGQKQVR